MLRLRGLNFGHLRPKRSRYTPLLGVHAWEKLYGTKANENKPAAQPQSCKPKVTEMEMIKSLGPHVWPPGPGTLGHKTRVVTSIGLLVGAKLVTIQVRVATLRSHAAVLADAQLPGTGSVHIQGYSGPIERTCRCWNPGRLGCPSQFVGWM
jgi:hypothetical protein